MFQNYSYSTATYLINRIEAADWHLTGLSLKCSQREKLYVSDHTVNDYSVGIVFVNKKITECRVKEKLFMKEKILCIPFHNSGQSEDYH